MEDLEELQRTVARLQARMDATESFLQRIVDKLPEADRVFVDISSYAPDPKRAEAARALAEKIVRSVPPASYLRVIDVRIRVGAYGAAVTVDENKYDDWDNRNNSDGISVISLSFTPKMEVSEPFPYYPPCDALAAAFRAHQAEFAEIFYGA